MPVMDGFQATKQIRQIMKAEESIKMYIIALTAYNTEQFEQKCLSIGMDYFLTKPIHDTKIIKLVK